MPSLCSGRIITHVCKQVRTRMDKRMRMSTATIPKKDIITINLPEVGDSISDATIMATPLVNGGGWVKKDTPIIQIETDKALIWLYAKDNGRLVNYLCNVTDEIEVGNPLYTFYVGTPAKDTWYVNVDEDTGMLV